MEPRVWIRVMSLGVNKEGVPIIRVEALDEAGNVVCQMGNSALTRGTGMLIGPVHVMEPEPMPNPGVLESGMQVLKTEEYTVTLADKIKRHRPRQPSPFVPGNN